MPRIEPDLVDSGTDHLITLWERTECFRYYVRLRRDNCTYTQLLDLSLQAPYCVSCMESDPFFRGHPPDVSSRAWQGDLRWKVGGNIVARTLAAIRWDPDYAFRCKNCGTELRPWDGDDLYVYTYHLEEHYAVPLERHQGDATRPGSCATISSDSTTLGASDAGATMCACTSTTSSREPSAGAPLSGTCNPSAIRAVSGRGTRSRKRSQSTTTSTSARTPRTATRASSGKSGGPAFGDVVTAREGDRLADAMHY